ncbi:hypothetical protein [Mesonia sp. HuA40]|uniref:hypothetical protein n=1 Tax=Mesonia sp. HuA40 TaxID=2602761 RepID=UPI0011C9D7BC|nr:hypothetical protein [Mesonia sp. HuA40]TXK74232.1 hypothetical protein FT993_02295 [Mesonia sp. HuA40]
MAAIKILNLLLILCPILYFGQKSIYPKDTIFIRYNKDIHSKKILNHPQRGKNLYFKNLGVYYSYSEKADTLCIEKLKDYHFSDLEEINEKRNRWIFDNKRPPASRNGVFQTYVIEVISDKKYVKYPVNWRNERI